MLNKIALRVALAVGLPAFVAVALAQAGVPQRGCTTSSYVHGLC